jgi:adenylate kinase
MVIVVLTGPPGAGKGTQAKVLADRLGVPAISTGDIFRAGVADGTELGARVKQYLDSGEYVPEDLTNEMVRERLSADDTRDGFVLDGYPRTLEQVGVLDALLAERNHSLDGAVVLEVGPDELVQRLLARAAAQHRSDDTEDVIRRRLQVYNARTVPVLDAYRARNLVIPVNGSGEVDEVNQRILEVADTLRTATTDGGETG